MSQLSVTGNGARHRTNLGGRPVSTAERAVVLREDLTTLELVVAILLAQGLRQWEVAKLMSSSVEGVRRQTARIREKTGARSTCHAVAELIRAGIIE
jgi:DNA-binding CsgD family transcriptional regulator